MRDPASTSLKIKEQQGPVNRHVNNVFSFGERK